MLGELGFAGAYYPNFMVFSLVNNIYVDNLIHNKIIILTFQHRTGCLDSRHIIQPALCVTIYYIWFAKFTALCQTLSFIVCCTSLVVLMHLVGIKTKGKRYLSHWNTLILLLECSMKIFSHHEIFLRIFLLLIGDVHF